MLPRGVRKTSSCWRRNGNAYVAGYFPDGPRMSIRYTPFPGTVQKELSVASRAGTGRASPPTSQRMSPLGDTGPGSARPRGATDKALGHARGRSPAGPDRHAAPQGRRREHMSPRCQALRERHRTRPGLEEGAWGALGAAHLPPRGMKMCWGPGGPGAFMDTLFPQCPQQL